ncbi:MltA domain-containing protein [soil metagenome]
MSAPFCGAGNLRLVSALVLIAGLAACATPAPRTGFPSAQIQPSAPPPPPPGFTPYQPAAPYAEVEAGAATSSPARLVGWDAEDPVAAFDAYLAGCGVSRSPAARFQCARALDIQRLSRPVTPDRARAFFETGFSVVAVDGPSGAPGLLTSYFAPEYPARHAQDGDFDMPVLAKPADLERTAAGVVQRRPDGSVGPYADRAAIEAAAAAGSPSAPVLAWMRAEDLFFLQIQGSGYLTFEDGSSMRAAYASDNGRPFAGIARPMEQKGLLPPNGTSGDAIRAWLAAHRGREARAITALNPRYIFFDFQPDDGGDPAGAAGVPLRARRSIAVDPAVWAYGDLAWIEADAGNLNGARQGYRGLVVALDTGSAIRGPFRADLYMGRGPNAGAEAGSVRHPLRMWRLVPRPE